MGNFGNLAIVRKVGKAVVFSEGAAPDFIGPRLARFTFAPTLPVHTLGLK